MSTGKDYSRLRLSLVVQTGSAGEKEGKKKNVFIVSLICINISSSSLAEILIGA